jgi:hypothetical protein
VVPILGQRMHDLRSCRAGHSRRHRPVEQPERQLVTEAHQRVRLGDVDHQVVGASAQEADAQVSNTSSERS